MGRRETAGPMCFAVVGPEVSDDGPFPYIFVEDDGSARELDATERAYLREEFHPADGGRPYVKNGYGDRTPDGRIGGFLRRDRLSARVVVRPANAP